VHWPSTAHRGALMVRQHELPWQASAVVYVDSRAHVHRGATDASTFERAVSAGASVLVHLQQQRYDIHLVTAEGSEAASHTATHLERAMTRLAEVQPSTDRSPLPALRAAEQLGNGIFVAVVRPPTEHEDLAEHVEVRALQQAGRGYARRIALIVAYDDGARCAVLARLLGLAGWHTAVAAAGMPLDEAWSRALVGAETTWRAGATR
jgi:uncharacterized protein (DUF58 family)